MHIFFIVLVLLDQITKAIFSDRDFSLIGLHLHPLNNYGLLFGLDFGIRWNFILMFVVYVAASWLVYSMPSRNKGVVLAKTVFLAGAASNLADRLIYGYVRDFIDLSLGFVFNLADLFIILGLVFMLVWNTVKPNLSGQPSSN